MIKSKDKTDKRIVDQYLVRQAHKRGIELQFEKTSLFEQNSYKTFMKNAIQAKFSKPDEQTLH